MDRGVRRGNKGGLCCLLKRLRVGVGRWLLLARWDGWRAGGGLYTPVEARWADVWVKREGDGGSGVEGKKGILLHRFRYQMAHFSGIYFHFHPFIFHVLDPTFSPYSFFRPRGLKLGTSLLVTWTVNSMKYIFTCHGHRFGTALLTCYCSSQTTPPLVTGLAQNGREEEEASYEHSSQIIHVTSDKGARWPIGLSSVICLY